jgi:transketolase
VQKKDGRSEKNKDKEVINVEDSVDKNAQMLSDPKVSLMPEAVVAPVQGPAGNTDVDLVENLANNRFSALVDNVVDDNVVDSIEAVQVVNEAQVDEFAGNEIENPVAVEVNDSSSEDSEFVDATQAVHGEVLGSDHDVDKTQQDMQFLKESWANIAEQEDDDLRLLAELEQDPASSGFKVVASKSSKKEKARLNRNLKPSSSYGTRSKVSVTKPFK